MLELIFQKINKLGSPNELFLCIIKLEYSVFCIHLS